MTYTDDDSAPPPPLASPLRRLGGFGVDTLIYAVLLLVVLVLSDLDLEAVANGDEAIPNSLLLIDLLLIGLYQVTLTATRGQTIGKMVLRTKVVDAETGRIPGWQSSFIRWGAPAALSTVPWLGYVTLLMYAWMLRDPRRQGLHDKAAQTLVIGVT
jgi:uncharacterized RDD family membrane protein YckC